MFRIICLIILELICGLVYSQELLPLYEMGIGGFYATFPDYPGASHNRTMILPFPSAIYRGDFLQATKDEGVRGRFINRKSIELDLSFDGTLPSDDSDTPERKDMPKLDTLIELGPKLRWKIIDSEHSPKTNFNFNLALRYGLSSDLKNTYGRGWIVNPFFELKFSDLLKKESFILTTLNFKFATRKLQGYYYDVDGKYSTQTRPAYHAKGGLMELSLGMLFYFPIKYQIWFFSGMIESFYQWAENKDGPLHVKDNATSLMIGLLWNFHQSEIVIENR